MMSDFQGANGVVFFYISCLCREKTPQKVVYKGLRQLSFCRLVVYGGRKCVSHSAETRIINKVRHGEGGTEMQSHIG